MAKIWNLILEQLNSTNKANQGAEVDLMKVIDQFYSLDKFLKSLHDRYGDLELDARNLCGKIHYKATIGRPRKCW